MDDERKTTLVSGLPVVSLWSAQPSQKNSCDATEASYILANVPPSTRAVWASAVIFQRSTNLARLTVGRVSSQTKRGVCVCGGGMGDSSSFENQAEKNSQALMKQPGRTKAWLFAGTSCPTSKPPLKLQNGDLHVVRDIPILFILLC